MDKKYNYDVEAILNKQFKIDFKGYHAEDVDSFLDGVIADYQAYDVMIKSLSKHLSDYENQVASLKERISELDNVQGKCSEQNTNHSNVDILKRLTRLENVVFKK